MKLCGEGKGVFIGVVILDRGKCKRSIIINSKIRNLILLKCIITGRLKVGNNFFKALGLYYI